LDVAQVYVVMVKSTGPAKLVSLDQALAWADTAKRAWLGRGWVDVGDECT
jgi:hypothetical protein